jgi:hypothetical protein
MLFAPRSLNLDQNLLKKTPNTFVLLTAAESPQAQPGEIHAGSRQRMLSLLSTERSSGSGLKYGMVIIPIVKRAIKDSPGGHNARHYMHCSGRCANRLLTWRIEIIYERFYFF